jgi:hypothetical protein
MKASGQCRQPSTLSQALTCWRPQHGASGMPQWRYSDGIPAPEVSLVERQPKIKTDRDDQVTESLLAFGALQVDHVLAFFDARGANPACPTCGRNDWEITRPDVDGATYFSLRPGGHGMPASSHVPSILLVCRNCAHVRIHAALPIVEWAVNEQRLGGK